LFSVPRDLYLFDSCIDDVGTLTGMVDGCDYRNHKVQGGATGTNKKLHGHRPISSPGCRTQHSLLRYRRFRIRYLASACCPPPDASGDELIGRPPMTRPLCNMRDQNILLDDTQIGQCDGRTDQLPTMGKAMLKVMGDGILHCIDF
jgi:hypothetical protein